MLEQKLDKISQENQNQVVNIKISDVYPNGDQPRIYFDEDKIIALCESIKKHGVLQPIVVRPDDEGRYMIIAGERRYRASIMANKESIPAIIKDMPIKEVLEIALVENLQRENLNIIEEAKAYKNLIDKHKSTQEELAELMCVTPVQISHYENDKNDIKVSVLRELARCLRVSTTYLLDGEIECFDKDVMQIAIVLQGIESEELRNVALEQLKVLVRVADLRNLRNR